MMEHINQLLKWKSQADCARDDSIADMVVTKRLLNHALEQHTELESLRAKIASLEQELAAIKEEKRQATAIVKSQCGNKGSASILRWALAEQFKLLAEKGKALKEEIRRCDNQSAIIHATRLENERLHSRIAELEAEHEELERQEPFAYHCVTGGLAYEQDRFSPQSRRAGLIPLFKRPLPAKVEVPDMPCKLTCEHKGNGSICGQCY